ncbi:MAG: hypothetical protein OXC18_24195 [Desulfurellaceae bacterium]|nr:hypothetical protein [Desulfurellaceae bacterium]
MKNLLSQIDFGNEAGDDVSPQEILNFFVEQQHFSDYLDPDQKILLATAKKGIGKSALMRWIEARKSAEEQNTPLVISVTGSDLVRSNFNLPSEPKLPNEYIRDWMQRICAIINRRIGAQLSVAITDDQITLVESAEIDGFKSRNLLSALTERLAKLVPQVEKSKKLAPNDIELLKRYSGRSVWVCVDDLDATYQRTDKENLELSTFFSACRYLASQTDGIVVRATMRTDVWTMIRRFDESLDKFDQYVTDITWSQADFRRLLARRVGFEMSRLGTADSPPPDHATKVDIDEHLIESVFEKRMEWGRSQKRTYRVVYTLSYHRPRWAIQLCKLAQKEALDSADSKISKSHIDSVWGPYGTKRIADLVAEHKHQCSSIEEIVVGFRGAERRLTKDQLLEWIKNKVTLHMTPVIEGTARNSPLEIAHFLFRLGFIVARIESPEEDGYEHYYFSDMPDFLSTRTNADFNAIWEIHPCYREALDIKKLNRNQRRLRDLER